MKVLVLLAAVAATSVSGTSQRCHVCKTDKAVEWFGNLICNEVPEQTPDCGMIDTGGHHVFTQECPPESNCLTITKKDQELRLCTRKSRIETMETKDGIVMKVCSGNMCNGAGRLVLSVPLVLLAIGAVLSRLA